MKKLFLIVVLGVSYWGSSAQPYFDKEATPQPRRQEYLAKTYGLTSAQIASYENALAARTKDVIAQNEQLLPKQEKRINLNRINAQFKNRVQEIFTSEQYAQWLKENETGAQTRRYKENLGLTDSQITQLKQAALAHRQERDRINKALLSDKEKEMQRKHALETRNREIGKIVGSADRDEVCRYLDIDDQSKFIRKHFSGLTSAKVGKIAELRVDYLNNVEALQTRNLNKRQYKTEHKALFSEFKSQMKPILTNEEYDKWFRDREIYFDLKIRMGFTLDKAQLNEYKKIMNQRAMGLLKIKKAPQNKGQDITAQVDALNQATGEKLAAIFSPEQIQVWLENVTN